MLGVRDVGGTGCWGYGMLGVWDVGGYGVGGSVQCRGKDVASTYRLCPRFKNQVSLISGLGLQTMEGDEYAETGK